MKAEIKVPAVGESITEATIAEWQKNSGDYVHRDDIVLTLETDKASVEVVAEHDGVLQTKVEEGETVEIGTTVGEIDTEAQAPAKADSPGQKESTEKTASKSNGSNGASPSSVHTLSPAVRKIVEENDLDPSRISGSGKDGRITKDDALMAVKQQASSEPSPSPATSEAKKPEAKAPLPPLPTSKKEVTQEEERKPMTTLRKRIAERLVQSQQEAAILTTFNEIDMSKAMQLRKTYKESFEKKHGIRLGFMGIFVKAAIEALKTVPEVNASIDGTDIVYHNYYNIGIAVSTPKGLVVPVIRNADQLSLAEIELSIQHYAMKAREGKITIDDLSGGTFTISNGGVFGSLMSTPILNPPQTGILGMHKIEDRPVAINGEVVIRPMMYVALSYDHRLIDGSESVGFLVKIKECVEDPARILLEV